ncbi:hypothetical protein GCM10007291_32680 [Gemmobacter nanjingensis]|uniref:DUF454 domain-containing protein n=1 Tax=Gemmobacter nanjingensis TaxID=488454 RepID=A0ABQ3FM92_9RHOB|nr:YbaN family protein [Gemmobacter nanjingensis]GHC29622.1 hypothetical protein GCM10007291_32680 [Gemmobacter nanjingensis]
MRILWLLLGVLALALGVIGIVTPILPTVPFLILAAFGFSKSSERLHNWIISHPRLGPPIMAWRERGAISPWAKRLSTGSMVASVLLALAIGLDYRVLALQATAMAAAALFIWTRPDA